MKLWEGFSVLLKVVNSDWGSKLSEENIDGIAMHESRMSRNRIVH